MLCIFQILVKTSVWEIQPFVLKELNWIIKTILSGVLFLALFEHESFEVRKQMPQITFINAEKNDSKNEYCLDDWNATTYFYKKAPLVFRKKRDFFYNSASWVRNFYNVKMFSWKNIIENCFADRKCWLRQW